MLEKINESRESAKAQKSKEEQKKSKMKMAVVSTSGENFPK